MCERTIDKYLLEAEKGANDDWNWRQVKAIIRTVRELEERIEELEKKAPKPVCRVIDQ